jgi:hypothetical protein
VTQVDLLFGVLTPQPRGSNTVGGGVSEAEALSLSGSLHGENQNPTQNHTDWALSVVSGGRIWGCFVGTVSGAK